MTRCISLLCALLERFKRQLRRRTSVLESKRCERPPEASGATIGPTGRSRTCLAFLSAEKDPTDFVSLRDAAGQVQLCHDGQVTTISRICAEIDSRVPYSQIYEVYEARRYTAIQSAVTRMTDPIAARALLTYAGYGSEVDVGEIFVSAQEAQAEALAALYSE